MRFRCQSAHSGVGAAATVVPDGLRGEPQTEADEQPDDHDIIKVAEYRNEIWNDIDG